jgi:hypothetical protein
LAINTEKESYNQKANTHTLVCVPKIPLGQTRLTRHLKRGKKLNTYFIKLDTIVGKS